MVVFSSIRLTKEMVVRIIADTLLINLAVLTALMLRFFYLVTLQSELAVPSARQVFWNYLTAYGNNTWLLTSICLIIFAIKGFYTYGRSYREGYKALMVVQATTISYLLFGFISYFVEGALHLPRGVIILALLLNIGLLVGARLWTLLRDRLLPSELRGRVSQSQPPKKLSTVLVIGGAGYIGSALLPKLLQNGYRVRLLDLFLYGHEPLKEVLHHPNLELVKADFRQVDMVVSAMQGMDSVIHLGAIVGDPACAVNAELTTEVNLMATRMIAEVAKGCGIRRFIFASTCSVYGASDEILDEHSALNPVSLYARSKIASERVLQQMADENFAPVILRFGTIYGLSGRTRFDLVINLLTAMAVIEGRITVYGSDQWRPFVHVDDAALAALKALQAPLEVVHNQIFNVGSKEQNYTIHQIGEIIHRMVPTAELTINQADQDRRNYRVNFNKIRNTLKYEPRWTVEQGIQQVLEAIQSGQVQNYQDACYSNVKFLQQEATSLRLRHLNQWAQELLNRAGSADYIPLLELDLDTGKVAS